MDKPMELTTEQQTALLLSLRESIDKRECDLVQLNDSLYAVLAAKIVKPEDDIPF